MESRGADSPLSVDVRRRRHAVCPDQNVAATYQVKEMQQHFPHSGEFQHIYVSCGGRAPLASHRVREARPSPTRQRGVREDHYVGRHPAQGNTPEKGGGVFPIFQVWRHRTGNEEQPELVSR